MIDNDYLKYRGKCREMCEKMAQDDPSLRLVRGYYDCPLWGRQQHWWLESPTGEIIDPTVKQFPTKGVCAEYIEFDGWLVCESCKKKIHENEAMPIGNYAVCSSKCYGRLVGICCD